MWGLIAIHSLMYVVILKKVFLKYTEFWIVTPNIVKSGIQPLHAPIQRITHDQEQQCKL